MGGPRASIALKRKTEDAVNGTTHTCIYHTYSHCAAREHPIVIHSQLLNRHYSDGREVAWCSIALPFLFFVRKHCSHAAKSTTSTGLERSVSGNRIDGIANASWLHTLPYQTGWRTFSPISSFHFLISGRLKRQRGDFISFKVTALHRRRYLHLDRADSLTTHLSLALLHAILFLQRKTTDLVSTAIQW